MNFGSLMAIEFKKVKRGKIVPLLFLAPFLVVVSGVANLQSYFTPEYTNAWAAMFIQSALVYAYYLLPFSMLVICVMIAGQERTNNGMLKMLALPVSRHALSGAKFCVLVCYLFMEMVVFLASFVIAGWIATARAGITEALPVVYLLRCCAELFVTMLPAVAVMWAVTVLSGKTAFAVGINLFLVIPGVLVANTPLWVIYPYCYSGYLVSCFMHDFTVSGENMNFTLFPFAVCALGIFAAALGSAVACFGRDRD